MPGWQTGFVTSPGPQFELGTDGPSLILVGVDGSRTSLRAAAYAGGLARRPGRPLLVVFVGRVPAIVTAAPRGSAVRCVTFGAVACRSEVRNVLLSADDRVAA